MDASRMWLIFIAVLLPVLVSAEAQVSTTTAPASVAQQADNGNTESEAPTQFTTQGTPDASNGNEARTQPTTQSTPDASNGNIAATQSKPDGNKGNEAITQPTTQNAGIGNQQSSDAGTISVVQGSSKAPPVGVECYQFNCSSEKDCPSTVAYNNTETCASNDGDCMIRKEERAAGNFTILAMCTDHQCDDQLFHSDANGQVTQKCCRTSQCNTETLLHAGSARLSGLIPLMVAALLIIRGAAV